MAAREPAVPQEDGRGLVRVERAEGAERGGEGVGVAHRDAPTRGRRGGADAARMETEEGEVEEQAGGGGVSQLEVEATQAPAAREGPAVVLSVAHVN